jgi:hypothetical protein
MCVVLYILGSGILDNPNVVPSFVFLLLACLSAWLACRSLEKAIKEKEYLPFVFSVLCVVCLIACFTFIYQGAEEQRRNDGHVEKMEFENHDYLLFKDKGVIHDPACECRSPFRKH